MARTVFITGATGNIGGKIVGHILENDRSAKLILLIRAESVLKAEERLVKVLQKLSPQIILAESRERIEILCGDITRPGLGLDKSQVDTLSSQITHIIHAAAATKFDQALESARRVNVGGTVNVMRFARLVSEHGRLQRVAHISTAYVCGNREGTIYENDNSGERHFSNNYERSKWEAEHYVRNLYPDLPVTVFRPSIVVGDSVTGRLNLFNVLYTPLRFVCRGDLPVIPCRRRTVLDIVPVDYVAGAVCHITFHTKNGAGKIFHITAGPDSAVSIDTIIERAIDHIKRNNPDRSLASPRFISPRLFGVVRRLLPTKSARLLNLLRIYEPYISMGKVFDCSNTAAALIGSNLRPPSLTCYFDNIMTHWLTAGRVINLKRAA